MWIAALIPFVCVLDRALTNLRDMVLDVSIGLFPLLKLGECLWDSGSICVYSLDLDASSTKSRLSPRITMPILPGPLELNEIGSLE